MRARMWAAMVFVMCGMGCAREPETDERAVMTIDGEPVPYRWFQHEFRSTFFRHGIGDEARGRAFAEFSDRMVLYAAARKAGIDRDPALLAKMESQQASMREFMAYQLDMARVSAVVQAYLDSRGIGLDAFGVTDDELLDHLKAEGAKHGQVVASLADVPAELLPQIRQGLQAARQALALQHLVAELRSTLVVQVSTGLVASVPFPEMRNAPPGFRHGTTSSLP